MPEIIHGENGVDGNSGPSERVTPLPSKARKRGQKIPPPPRAAVEAAARADAARSGRPAPAPRAPDQVRTAVPAGNGRLQFSDEEEAEYAASAPEPAPATRRGPLPGKGRFVPSVKDAQDEIRGAAALEVDRAELHDQIMFQGFTNDHLNDAKPGQNGIKMVWVKYEGLLISLRGKEAIIPAPMVKIAHIKGGNSGRIVED